MGVLIRFNQVNAVTFESVYVWLTVLTCHVLYTHIMCNKTYHPKNDSILVYGFTYYTVNSEVWKSIFTREI